nr:DUF2867 domain-containing protein [Ensifer sp. BR816]
MTAPEAALRALRNAMGWVRSFWEWRNRVAAAIGLNAAPHPTHSDLIGSIPIIHSGDRETVVGYDARHLHFRVVMDVREGPADGQVIGMTRSGDSVSPPQYPCTRRSSRPCSRELRDPAMAFQGKGSAQRGIETRLHRFTSFLASLPRRFFCRGAIGNRHRCRGWVDRYPSKYIMPLHLSR